MHIPKLQTFFKAIIICLLWASPLMLHAYSGHAFDEDFSQEINNKDSLLLPKGPFGVHRARPYDISEHHKKHHHHHKKHHHHHHTKQHDRGPRGRRGRDGLNGANGLNGQDGAIGRNGATGPAGPAGPIGPTGPTFSPSLMSVFQEMSSTSATATLSPSNAIIYSNSDVSVGSNIAYNATTGTFFINAVGTYEVIHGFSCSSTATQVGVFLNGTKDLSSVLSVQSTGGFFMSTVSVLLQVTTVPSTVEIRLITPAALFLEVPIASPSNPATGAFCVIKELD